MPLRCCAPALLCRASWLACARARRRACMPRHPSLPAPPSCSLLLLSSLPLHPQAGYLPMFPELKLASNAPFGLTSFALSLLLVFR